MKGSLRYAYLDDAPVVFDDAEAWHLVGKTWQALPLADAMSNARLLTKAEFDDYASAAPPLPSTAFH